MSGGIQMNKDNSSWIIKRSVPKIIADKVEKVSFDRDISWHLLLDNTFSDSKKNPGFSHAMNHHQSEVIELGFPLNFFHQHALKKRKNLLRAHLTLNYPRPDVFGKPHNPHIDNDDPHEVLLYYVNDCDGDTFFFNDDMSVKYRHTPKKGEYVIFNGMNYHASSSPSKNIRITLNINYAIEN